MAYSSIPLQSGALTRRKIHGTIVGGIVALKQAEKELGGVDITPKKAKKPEVATRLNKKGQELLQFSKEIKEAARVTSSDLGHKGVKEYVGRSKAAENIGKALLAIKPHTTIDQAVGKIAGAYTDASINEVAVNGPESEKVGYENIVALETLGTKSMKNVTESRSSKIKKLKTKLEKPEIKAIVGEVEVEKEIKEALEGKSKAA